MSTAVESTVAIGVDGSIRETTRGRGRRQVGRILVAAVVLGAAVATWAEDRVAIEASRSGFKPKALTMRKGDVVHLVLTTADGEHCFAVDALRIEKRIVPGKSTELDLTVDRPGTLPFYCCLEPEDQAQRGRLVVTE